MEYDDPKYINPIQERELSWVRQLREYARSHYDQEGWDYLVECWSDEDILEKIPEGCTTYQQLFGEIQEILRRMDSRRKDVEGEIF
jgi:hypothetical protein